MALADHLKLVMIFQSGKNPPRNTHTNLLRLVVLGKYGKQPHNLTKQHRTKNDDEDGVNFGGVLPRFYF